MPIAHCNKEYIEKESDDSDYDKPPVEEDLLKELPTRPVTESN